MTPVHLLKAYEGALNSHDVGQLDDLVDQNAIFIFTDGTFKGISEIKTACQKTWDYFENEVYGINDVVWLHEDQFSASCTYTINWSADLNGERQFFKGRGTTILTNTQLGWRIIHEHLSRMPDEATTV